MGRLELIRGRKYGIKFCEADLHDEIDGNFEAFYLGWIPEYQTNEDSELCFLFELRNKDLIKLANKYVYRSFWDETEFADTDYNECEEAQPLEGALPHSNYFFVKWEEIIFVDDISYQMYDEIN